MIVNIIGAIAICAIGLFTSKRLIDFGLKTESMVQGVLIVTSGITFGIMAGYLATHLLLQK